MMILTHIQRKIIRGKQMDRLANVNKKGTSVHCMILELEDGALRLVP